MTSIVEWISPKYHDPKKLAALYKKQKPFPHISLKNFLHAHKARALEQSLARVSFVKKESDLFKLSQSQELRHSTDPVLLSFRSLLLSKEFSAWMACVSGTKLTNKELDMGASLYEDTDFLLCHDDRVTGRKIAYILYLNKTFSTKDGGALVLFDTKKGHPAKIVKRYVPSWNTLNFFTVSAHSWHAVEEVVRDKKRLSINGWFH